MTIATTATPTTAITTNDTVDASTAFEFDTVTSAIVGVCAVLFVGIAGLIVYVVCIHRRQRKPVVHGDRKLSTESSVDFGSPAPSSADRHEEATVQQDESKRVRTHQLSKTQTLAPHVRTGIFSQDADVSPTKSGPPVDELAEIDDFVDNVNAPGAPRSITTPKMRRSTSISTRSRGKFSVTKAKRSFSPRSPKSRRAFYSRSARGRSRSAQKIRPDASSLPLPSGVYANYDRASTLLSSPHSLDQQKFSPAGLHNNNRLHDGVRPTPRGAAALRDARLAFEQEAHSTPSESPRTPRHGGRRRLRAQRGAARRDQTAPSRSNRRRKRRQRQVDLDEAGSPNRAHV